MSNVKTSAVITSVGTNNKVISKAITDINPNADNAAIRTLCQSLNSLTTNTFTGAQRIDKTDITTAATKPKLNVTLSSAVKKITTKGDEEGASALFSETVSAPFTYEIDAQNSSDDAMRYYPINFFIKDNNIWFSCTMNSAGTETFLTYKIYFEETETTAATVVQIKFFGYAAPVLTIL